MDNTTRPTPAPAPTRAELQRILDEVSIAYGELCEMIEVWENIGSVEAIWQIPRKYFAPEDNGSPFPYPTEDLLILVEPVWKFSESPMPDGRELVDAIISYLLFFGLRRPNIVPE